MIQGLIQIDNFLEDEWSIRDQALELNLNLPQALNNIAVIYHYQGVKASKKQNLEVAKGLFDKAAEYWRQAIKLAPNNYIEAQNWLKTTGRMSSEDF